MDVTDRAAALEVLLARGNDPFAMFAGIDDDLWVWINTEGYDQSARLREILPELPAPAVQEHWVGKSGLAAQLEGNAIYRTVRDLRAEYFGPLRGPILDFGCGFGRVMRYWLKDLPAAEIVGSDHDEELVDICRTTNRWCEFTRNEAHPPLSFEDGRFGLVYAYSVFSHFSEAMHREWLTELRRVLRPGGAALLTVRRRKFIEYCKRSREDTQGPSKITQRMFPDADESLAAYDRGEFCFTSYRPDGWWGEAVIPRTYIDTHWSGLFDVVTLAETDLMQDVVVLRA